MSAFMPSPAGARTVMLAAPASRRHQRPSLAAACMAVALIAILAPSVPASASPAPGEAPIVLARAAQSDNDGDGIPNDMDPDDDSDGTEDNRDPNPAVPDPPAANEPDIIAPDQDTDGDGINNEMDPDDDNDVIEDDQDPAPFAPVPPSETPAPPAPTPKPSVPAPGPTAPPAVERPEDSGGTGQGRPVVREPEAVSSGDGAPLVVALPVTGGFPGRSGSPDTAASVFLLAAAAAVLVGSIIRGTRWGKPGLTTIWTGRANRIPRCYTRTSDAPPSSQSSARPRVFPAHLTTQGIACSNTLPGFSPVSTRSSNARS